MTLPPLPSLRMLKSYLDENQEVATVAAERKIGWSVDRRSSPTFNYSRDILYSLTLSNMNRYVSKSTLGGIEWSEW